MDTAGSDQVLMTVTGKSGTFCGHTQICHHRIVPHLFTKCQKGRERLFGMRTKIKKPSLLEVVSFSFARRERPFLPFQMSP